MGESRSSGEVMAAHSGRSPENNEFVNDECYI